MNNLTVKEALPVFYKDYNLPVDGGANDSSVKIELLKGIYIYIPNFEDRKKVVLKHDIHHLVTGYTGRLKGETEISSWELSSGCSNNWAAFSINTYSMMIGIIWNLPGLWKAWLRGKRTSNLYHERYTDEMLLNQKVSDLKKELGFQEEDPKKVYIFTAFLSFIWFLIFGTMFSLISLLLLPFVVLYSIIISIRNYDKNIKH
jgi:hypothetical protein